MRAAHGVLAARGHFAAWRAIDDPMTEPHTYLHGEALAGHGGRSPTQPQGSASAFVTLVAAGIGHNVCSGCLWRRCFFACGGTESAAWIMFDAPDLLNDAAFLLVQFGISDWARVALKSLVPVEFGNLFCLETNAQVRLRVIMFIN